MPSCRTSFLTDTPKAKPKITQSSRSCIYFHERWIHLSRPAYGRTVGDVWTGNADDRETKTQSSYEHKQDIGQTLPLDAGRPKTRRGMSLRMRAPLLRATCDRVTDTGHIRGATVATLCATCVVRPHGFCSGSDANRKCKRFSPILHLGSLGGSSARCWCAIVRKPCRTCHGSQNGQGRNMCKCGRHGERAAYNRVQSACGLSRRHVSRGACDPLRGRALACSTGP